MDMLDENHPEFIRQVESLQKLFMVGYAHGLKYAMGKMREVMDTPDRDYVLDELIRDLEKVQKMIDVKDRLGDDAD